MENIETAWSVNESLLQSYRSTFISSQSFLLAVGAILFDKNEFLIYLLTPISVFIIWYVWFRVVVTRARIVDYYKFQLDHPSINISKNFCKKEKVYVKDREARLLMNAEIGEKNWRLTRYKIDILLPVLFTTIWLIIAIIKWHSCITNVSS